MLFGVCYALLLPPLQAPDEFAHFYRAYGDSEGYVITAPRLTPIPQSIQEMASAFPPHVEVVRFVGAADIVKYLQVPLNPARSTGVPNETINRYSSLPYLPAAVGILTARILSVPPAGVLYFARFANLFVYLALVYLALRMLPDFQLPLLGVALMPMALNQAASASWDAIAFSAAFFLCAYILTLAWDPAITTYTPRQYAILAATIIVASVCRTDIWLLPLVIFLPASRFQGSRRKWTVLLGYFVLAFAVVAGWNFLNRNNMAVWIEQQRSQQIMFSDNFAFVFQYPWIFLQTFVRTCRDRWPDLAVEFVGKLGWLVVNLPTWAVWLYLAMLSAVALAGTVKARLTTLQRLVCLGIAGAAVASTFVATWCTETPVAYKENVLHGLGDISGVQGRYFIPFAFPLLLALSNTRWRVDGKRLFTFAAVIILLVNGLAVQRIYATYYASGDPAIDYDNKLVKRAGTTAEDDKVFFIRSGQRHWVTHASWIVKHGFRWPEDVRTIPAPQLAAIPEGDTITEE